MLYEVITGQVSAGIGVFGTEGRAEGVHLGQCTGIGLDIQLTGNGKEGFLAEEVV